MKFRLRIAMLLALVLGTGPRELAQKKPLTQASEMDRLYRDEGHCLTLADMRGDRDKRISCFCRDAIADARYVYFRYLLQGKDSNLNGVFLRLTNDIQEECGQDLNGFSVAVDKDWKWDGPEVSRTYPAGDVIKRIKPELKDGRAVGRWVPFVLQLIYHDGQGRVTRTENYSSREFIPNLDVSKPHP
jgi:hypothetical protein